MDDNNEHNVNNENSQDNIMGEKKDACLLLRDLAIEFEEQLYSIKIQLKTQLKLLLQKENELEEQERTRVHNLDLFSPIYNKSQDMNEGLTQIEQIKIKIDKLEKEKEQVERKVSGLKLAAGYLEKNESDYENNNNVKANDRYQKYGDKGLSILEAQEIERQRIARDLHDSTVQNLTSLVHKCELSTKLIDIDSTRAKLELISMSNTIKTVINDMRGIIYNLKPMILDDLGLTITIERYANRLMDLNNIIVKVNANEETKEILYVIKLTLFRIIQEACNNVIKHANASEININIIYQEHHITVIIKDNGNGFSYNIQQADISKQSSSFGLSIMRERISLLSGTIDIQSERGIGTTVIVSAPITINEGDKNEKTD